MKKEQNSNNPQNPALRVGAVSGSLLSDKAIEEYAFETYHDVEDSRWFEPLQVGAKWSRDTLIAEIQRRQQMLISEPDGIVRETMINDLLVGLQ
jgi:hypothetical protein